jgi:hypothetical protein
VNCKQYETIRVLLDAGANANCYTGPLRNRFPVRDLIGVMEYSWKGHRYVTHLCCVVNVVNKLVCCV